jgi:hypothetical protein
MKREAFKYMRSCVVIRRQGRHAVQIYNEYLENVAVLKYSGTVINNQNYVYEKVKCTVI